MAAATDRTHRFKMARQPGSPAIRQTERPWRIKPKKISMSKRINHYIGRNSFHVFSTLSTKKTWHKEDWLNWDRLVLILAKEDLNHAARWQAGQLETQ